MVNTGRSSTIVKVAVLEQVLPGERMSVTSTVYSPAPRFANVSLVAPAIGLDVPVPLYHWMVKSVAAGTPPFTSMVIDPLGVAPVQCVLSVIVFCVITGVTLASFTVNCTKGEAQLEVVFVALTK